MIAIWVFACVVAALVSWAATTIYGRLAHRYWIIDSPTVRSSHSVPTPTGGGLGILAGFCLAASIATMAVDIGPEWRIAMCLSAALAVLGYCDDRYDLSVHWRFCAHVLAAVAMLAALRAAAPETQEACLHLSLLAVSAAAVLCIVWMTNLFNFMDGIDGLAGAEAVFIAASAALLIWLEHGANDSVMLLTLLASATLGFLVLNWQPARIFMGDTGSLMLGFLLSSASLIAVVRQELNLWVCFILWSAFIVDASLTLLIRVLYGNPPHQPHRNHAYQRLARMYNGHGLVSAAYSVINIAWLLPLAFTAMRVPEHALAVVVVAYLPLVSGVLVLHFCRQGE